MQLPDTSAPNLKNYIIGECLGYGSSSIVFQVADALTKKNYVLKQISLDSVSDEEQLRAKKEILVMNDVDHPNIVKFRESFSGRSSVNIIMEFCEMSLEELIERQQEENGEPFPENVIIEWMAELLCALAYLHSRRILHRDIKTSNIFLTEKNHMKLGDFGVCTVLTSTSAGARSMIGTPLYFSPEVCEEEAYDERSDVWSLGVVFYEMCTLRHPFEAEHLPGLIRQILRNDVAPFNTGLDSRFEDLVRGMLSKNPRDRPTAQDLIDNHLVVPASHPSHPLQKPSRGRLIQEYYGPELVFGKKGEKEKGEGKERSTQENRILGEENDEDQENQDQQLRFPIDKKLKPLPKKSRKPPSRPGKVVRNKEKGIKKEVMDKKNIGKGAGKELNSEEREDAMKRIKGAKSKINMAELRQNMLKKRYELFGELNAPPGGDVPMVIELQESLRPAISNDNLSDDFEEGSPTVRPRSSFLEDISAVMKLHSKGDVKIALEELEDAALLLCQYKLTNYGLQ